MSRANGLHAGITLDVCMNTMRRALLARDEVARILSALTERRKHLDLHAPLSKRDLSQWLEEHDVMIRNSLQTRVSRSVDELPEVPRTCPGYFGEQGLFVHAVLTRQHGESANNIPALHESDLDFEMQVKIALKSVKKSKETYGSENELCGTGDPQPDEDTGMAGIVE